MITWRYLYQELLPHRPQQKSLLVAGQSKLFVESANSFFPFAALKIERPKPVVSLLANAIGSIRISKFHDAFGYPAWDMPRRNFGVR
jgi:hypothetical protein